MALQRSKTKLSKKNILAKGQSGEVCQPKQDEEGVHMENKPDMGIQSLSKVRKASLQRDGLAQDVTA